MTNDHPFSYRQWKTDVFISNSLKTGNVFGSLGSLWSGEHWRKSLAVVHSEREKNLKTLKEGKTYTQWIVYALKEIKAEMEEKLRWSRKQLLHSDIEGKLQNREMEDKLEEEYRHVSTIWKQGLGIEDKFTTCHRIWSSWMWRWWRRRWWRGRWGRCSSSLWSWQAPACAKC